MFRPPDWTRDAACLGMHEEHDEGRATSALLARCRQCPVQAQCAAHMLKHEVAKPRDFRATFAAGLGAGQRAQLDARATRCVGCGANTGKGPCEPCIRKGKHALDAIKVRELRCIQCGGETGDRRSERCKPCVGNEGRW